MQSYTELTPPTAVTHSLSLPFLSASANNLVVAKTSLLQIFSFKSVIADADNGLNKQDVQETSLVSHNDQDPTSAGIISRSERLHTTKLVLIAQYSLSGTVTALSRVKILDSKSGGEALLVSFRNAKLSLVEWDPEQHSMSTISIHYYEREEIQGSPWQPHLGQCVTHLSVDPRSRCAALKFGLRHIAILPFHQPGDELVMDDYDPEIDGERHDVTAPDLKSSEEAKRIKKTPYAASFVLSLLALDPSLSYPLHLAFLYEYREPTFGILSSQVALSTAMLNERRDTMSYTVFTLDLEQKASTTLLSVTGLPYDLFAVSPLPLPIGGALLIGANELIHVDQAGKTNGIAVNEFAKQCTSFPLQDQSELGLRLESCIIEQLGRDSRELLMILNTGELAIVTFRIDGRSISGISIRCVSHQNGGLLTPAGASCASIIGRGRMFIGSERANSVVLGWSRRTDRLKRQRSRSHLELTMETDPVQPDEEYTEDDDEDLYSGAYSDEQLLDFTKVSSEGNSSDDCIFRIHELMQNVGPMQDVTIRYIVKDTTKDASIPHVLLPKIEILTCSGSNASGGLTIFNPKITPDAIKKLDILEAQGVWTVRVGLGQQDGILQAGSSGNPEYDKYLVISSASRDHAECSGVYQFGTAGLEEVKSNDFDSEAGATVEVGLVNNGTRIVQVLASELRAFDKGQFSLVNFLHVGVLKHPEKWDESCQLSCSIFAISSELISDSKESWITSYRRHYGVVSILYAHVYSSINLFRCLIALIQSIVQPDATQCIRPYTTIMPRAKHVLNLNN